MDRELRTVVQVSALVAVVIMAIIAAVTYVSIRNGPTNHTRDMQELTEETKRITACVNAGGEWTDINERSGVDMGCIRS